MIESKRTEITARVDKEIVRAKAHHVESTHFLIVPTHFLVPLPLFLRQVARWKIQHSDNKTNKFVNLGIVDFVNWECEKETYVPAPMSSSSRALWASMMKRRKRVTLIQMNSSRNWNGKGREHGIANLVYRVGFVGGCLEHWLNGQLPLFLFIFFFLCLLLIL